MAMVKMLAVVAAVLMVVGSAQAKLPDLATMSLPDLCKLQSQLRDSKSSPKDLARVERTVLEYFTGDERGWVMARDVYVGMSDMGVYCSWGQPNRINTTTTRRGESQQWVYDNAYVYIEGGVVTAIQQSR